MTTDTPITPPSGPQMWDYPTGPVPVPKASSSPSSIAALIASVAIMVGSLGPWLTFMAFERGAIDGDGAYTLGMGAIATAAMLVVLCKPRLKEFSYVAIVMAVLAFLVGVVDANEVLSRNAEVFGATLGPQIGWGLWLVLIGSAVLVVTAVVTIRQAPK